MSEKQSDSLGDKEFLKEMGEVVSDFQDRKKTEVLKKEMDEKKQVSQEKARKKMRVINICFLFLLALILGIIIFRPNGIFSKPRPWVAGGIWESDKQIVPCVNRLWHMRYLVDEYYKLHNGLPWSLEDLAKVDFKREQLVCPLSGKPYRLEEVENVKVFICPNPRAHNVVKVWLNVASGPPAIERD